MQVYLFQTKNNIRSVVEHQTKRPKPLVFPEPILRQVVKEVLSMGLSHYVAPPADALALSPVQEKPVQSLFNEFMESIVQHASEPFNVDGLSLLQSIWSPAAELPLKRCVLAPTTPMSQISVVNLIEAENRPKQSKRKGRGAKGKTSKRRKKGEEEEEEVSEEEEEEEEEREDVGYEHKPQFQHDLSKSDYVLPENLYLKNGKEPPEYAEPDTPSDSNRKEAVEDFINSLPPKIAWSYGTGIANLKALLGKGWQDPSTFWGRVVQCAYEANPPGKRDPNNISTAASAVATWLLRDDRQAYVLLLYLMDANDVDRRGTPWAVHALRDPEQRWRDRLPYRLVDRPEPVRFPLPTPTNSKRVYTSPPKDTTAKGGRDFGNGKVAAVAAAATATSPSPPAVQPAKAKAKGGKGNGSAKGKGGKGKATAAARPPAPVRSPSPTPPTGRGKRKRSVTPAAEQVEGRRHQAAEAEAAEVIEVEPEGEAMQVDAGAEAEEEEEEEPGSTAKRRRRADTQMMETIHMLQQELAEQRRKLNQMDRKQVAPPASTSAAPSAAPTVDTSTQPTTAAPTPAPTATPTTAPTATTAPSAAATADSVTLDLQKKVDDLTKLVTGLTAVLTPSTAPPMLSAPFSNYGLLFQQAQANPAMAPMMSMLQHGLSQLNAFTAGQSYTATQQLFDALISRPTRR
jgi:hypothetical protein